jgi:hypothetical protein
MPVTVAKYIPLNKANLLGLFLETNCYGIFFTLYWITITVMSKKTSASTSTQNRMVLPVATLLLLIASAVSATRTYILFIPQMLN